MKITIRRNSIDPSFDVICQSNVGPAEFLHSYFDQWPKTAVIYRNDVCEENKVPLKTSDDIKALDAIIDDIIVVIYPAGIWALTALVYAFGFATTFLGGSKKKSTSDQVAQRKEPKAGSPNNGLSERSNVERLNQRIPEIYGAVRSFPDLLCKPWREYRANQEVEVSYFCVGRGEYEISDIKDGDTPFNQIGRSTSIEVYGPNTSPNYGSPQLTVGKPITADFVSARPCNAVTGQKLFAPNADTVTSNAKFIFYPDRIEIDNEELEYGETTDTKALSFTDVFEIGNQVEINGTSNVDNTYDIVGVESQVLYLDNPSAVDGSWTTFSSGGTPQAASQIELIRVGTNEVGPFIVDGPVNAVYCNFFAEGGLYKDNGTNQYGLKVLLQIWAQEVDESDAPVGSPVGTDVFINGSSGNRYRVAVTGKLTGLPGWSRAKVWAERITDTDLAFDGTKVDLVQWETLYAVETITNNHFGDVTTIFAVTYATPGALAVKERKLNCLAKRIIPVWNGTSYTDGPTSYFADILRFVCLDPKVGNRQLSELNMANFYSTQTAIQLYFGTNRAIEFNYTFDETDFSFEETVRVICEAVFCSAYRQGSLISLTFERENANSRLLFNHRNKLPNSETRSVRFGTNEDKDGVELEYVDSKDGAKVKFYIPEDQSAVNPETMALIGITNKIQAYFHAHRLYNKQRYQNCSVEFDGLQEASLLAITDRILVADNTRPNTWDGEVIDQDGTTLTLSQNFDFEDGADYTIFLQNVDGSVQALGISAGVYRNQIVLDSGTTLPLSVDHNAYTRATYEIVENSSERQRAFLIEEKSNKDSFVVTVKASNYDDRYYTNDQDFNNDVIDESGNEI